MTDRRDKGISFLAALCLLALGVYRHRSNLERLKNGTENKLGQKAKQ